MRKIIAVCLLVLTSCRTSDPAPKSAPGGPAPETADLTESQARERKERVANVRYQLALELNEKDEVFHGTNKIRFDLKGAAKPLRLDFFEGQVTALRTNGVAVPLTAKRRFWIDLPAGALKEGANLVEVEYSAAYTRQGIGLHRFVDPETKDVFIYSKLEPYEANRVFPCFDQPDLRATWELTVDAPKRWNVMHTTRETKVADAGEGRRRWAFPTTPAIATYLFSMHAGPYQIWTDKFEDIPLRLWARPSVAKFVRAKEWFGWTKKGLGFFNRYFAYKYPFKKYDQIFVPEASGAMENVAAVTFTENVLQRGEPTRAQSRATANVLMHEMAHMWFGDIVTMAWWNDLWLNESFATYMASLALHEVTEFKESWQNFFNGSKSGAYFEDGLVTTHPIETRVDGVKDGLAAFDQITYGKGASVLKQLRAYIGDHAFDEGIREYIRTHQFGNTTLPDFIGALQKQTRKDLSAWAAVWLRQSGTDRLEAQWTCAGDRLREIRLVTTPSAGAKFRPQSVRVALFPAGASVAVDVVGPETRVAGDWACPSFVYPNYGDYGYASVRLDAASLTWVSAHLSELKDELLRSQLWRDLWEMVRTGDMPLKAYIEILDKNFAGEKDVLVLGRIADTITDTRRGALTYWPPASPGLDAFIKRMEAQFLGRLKGSRPGSDAQKFWLDQFGYLARSPEGLAQIQRWVEGRDRIPGFKLDVDRRWWLARRLARFEVAAAPSLLDELIKEDGSDRGRRNRMAADAVVPSPDVKAKWIKRLSVTKPPDLSLMDARMVMGSLFPLEQAALAAPFDTTVMDYLRESARADNEVYLRSYASALSPLSCEPGRAARFREFLSKNEFPLAVRRPMQVNLQEDERCLLVRQRAGL